MNATRITKLVDWLKEEALAKYYGITTLDLTKGYCRLQMTANDKMTVSVGIVQAGVTCIFADFAGVMAAMSCFPEGHTPCVEVDLNFFAPIKVGEVVYAEVEIRKVTQKFIFARVTVVGTGGDGIKAEGKLLFSTPRRKK